MSDYALQWPKPTWLYCSHPWIEDILQFRTHNTRGTVLEKEKGKALSRVTHDARGRARVSGNKDTLKESQSYTRQFGEAVCRLYDMHAEDLAAEATKLIPVEPMYNPQNGLPTDTWEDAGLPKLLAYLGAYA